MNPDQQLEQDIAAVAAELPAPLREFVASGKPRMVAKQIMQTYQLRVDQAGVVSREIFLLLLGMRNPEQFSNQLKTEAAIEPTVVENIISDVNQQIFIPLRNQMRQAPVPVSRPIIPPPNYAPEVPASPPTASVQPATSLQPHASPPIAVPHFSGPRPAITIPVPPQPSAPQVSQQARTVPPPPPNLPGAMPPVTPQPQPAAKPPAARIPAPPPPPRVPGTPDPYREPLE